MVDADALSGSDRAALRKMMLGFDYMTAPLNRQELLQLIEQITNAHGTEEELDQAVRELEANVPHPQVLDLMFYHKSDETPTATQVLDEAMSYRAIRL